MTDDRAHATDATLSGIQRADDVPRKLMIASSTEQGDATYTKHPRQLDARTRQQEYWNAWETSVGVTETNNGVLIRDATLIAEGKRQELSQVID